MKRICCVWLQWVVNLRRFPITYDEATAEVQLTASNSADTSACFLTYCPFCGVRLPSSSRTGLGELAEEPEVRRLLLIAECFRNVREMIALLGDPDETQVASRVLTIDPWVRAYEYRNLSPRCRLTIKEYADARLRAVVGLQLHREPAGKSTDGTVES